MRDHFQTRFNTVSDTRFGLSLSLGTHADRFCPGGLFDRASLPIMIGLPRTCAGVKLASSTDDEAWPCPPLIRLPEFREFGMCLQRQPTTAGPELKASTEVAGGLAHNVNAWMSVVNCDINVE